MRVHDNNRHDIASGVGPDGQHPPVSAMSDRVVCGQWWQLSDVFLETFHHVLGLGWQVQTFRWVHYGYLATCGQRQSDTIWWIEANVGIFQNWAIDAVIKPSSIVGFVWSKSHLSTLYCPFLMYFFVLYSLFFVCISVLHLQTLASVDHIMSQIKTKMWY